MKTRQRVRMGIPTTLMFLFPVIAFYFSLYPFLLGASYGVLAERSLAE